MVLHCGGLLVDGGWLRVFGSPVDGAARGVPSLAQVNRDGDVVAVAVGGVHGGVDGVDEAVGAGLPAGDLPTAMEGDAHALVGVCAVGGEQRAERIGIGAVPVAGPADDDLGRCRPAD